MLKHQDTSPDKLSLVCTLADCITFHMCPSIMERFSLRWIKW